MTIVTKPENTPSAPNAKTTIAEGAASIPVSKTTVPEANPAIPVSKTTISESAAAIPVSKTTIAEESATIPTVKTTVAAVSAAIPTSKTTIDPAGVPRALIPLVDMHFFSDQYMQGGNSVLFDDLFTYSRNSNATFWNRRINQRGKREYFLDTDFVGTVENLALFSEQIDNAVYTKNTVTVVDDEDGIADRVYPTSTGTLRGVSQAITLTTAEHTVSFEVKKAGFKWIKIFDAANANGAWFNVDVGVIGTISGTCVAQIVLLDDGYYRCSITDAGAVSGFAKMILADADNSTTATTSGTDGVLLKRVQVTLSAKPLPYVKSVASATSDTFTENLRIHYDPATGQALGAFLEGGITSLFTRSEEADHANWTKGSAAITANDAIAPDETTSADKFAADSTATILPFIRQAITTIAAEDYTISWHVKKLEATFVQISFTSAGVANDPRVNFDLINGVLGTQDADIDKATIESDGQGGYRISATVQAVGTSLTPQLLLMKSATDTRNQTNAWTAGDGVHIWGAQAENLPNVSSYNRTEGSTVVRAKDNLSLSSAGNYNESQGTIVCNLITPPSHTGNNQYLYSVDDGTNANRNNAFIADLLPTTFIQTNSVAVVNYTSSIWVEGDEHDMLVTYKDDDVNTYIDGAADGSDNSCIMPQGISVINIGQSSANGSQFFGSIKKLAIYEEIMTAQEAALA